MTYPKASHDAHGAARDGAEVPSSPRFPLLTRQGARRREGLKRVTRLPQRLQDRVSSRQQRLASLSHDEG